MMKGESGQKAILFGSGDIYGRYKDIAFMSFDVVAVADNNESLQGKMMDGIHVISPECIPALNADVVILMSDSANEMWNQLEEMGYPKNKVMHYKELIGIYGEYEPKRYKGTGYGRERGGKKVLIITNSLGFHGVSVLSLRAAKCIVKLGYDVSIAAAYADDRYIKEANECGVSVIVQPNMQNASYRNLVWIDDFDLIILNSAVMTFTALTISERRKVMLWLHESPWSYKEIWFWHDVIKERLQKENNILIYAVSDKARQNFCREYGYERKIDILPVAIEDWRTHIRADEAEDREMCFAVIGSLQIEKGQDVFIDAVERISNRTNRRGMFWLIGKKTKNDYGKSIYNRAFPYNNIILYGERSQNELKKLFQYIDVVVVPSRAETFSMAAAEAMMMGKPCIVSDECGIGEFINDGGNGFLFPSEDAESLSEIMKWCILHPDKLQGVGESGRKTYETFFSMGQLQKNLEQCLALLKEN